MMVLGAASSCESSCILVLLLTWLMSAWLAMSFDPSTMCSRPGWGVIRWSLRTSSHESRTLPSWSVMLNVIGSGLHPGYLYKYLQAPQVCDRIEWCTPSWCTVQGQDSLVLYHLLAVCTLLQA